MPPASRQKSATARPAHAHVKDHISLHELSALCSFLCSKISVMFLVFIVYYTVPCVPDQISTAESVILNCMTRLSRVTCQLEDKIWH